MKENNAGVGESEGVICEPFSENFWNKCFSWLEIQLHCWLVYCGNRNIHDL